MSTTIMALATLAALILGTWVAFKLLCGLFWLLGHTFRFIGLAIQHVFRFLRNEIVDVLHFLGAILTMVVVVPLALVNLLIFRLPQAAHYGKAVEDEFLSSLLCLYRVSIGHPLRLIGFGPLLDGLERRVPDIVEHAPRRKPRADEKDRFPGYHVVDVLPQGGSGAQLFVAEPRPEKAVETREAGIHLPRHVVIKSFAVSAGSTIPQIVRESRALSAARELGLVLEHSLGDDHFYYVMPYVGGENLSEYVQHLHEASPAKGLGGRQLGLVVGLTQDLLHTLERFHGVGLWHKDVKPANLIVAGERAHLVDLGLVTPLQSAMTLTTHGTEYYRDPEMVRQAMQGVKVHEVDGVKFDLYSAGAVLYSMIENSFPAHGSLSRITKRCPEALQWIVRRAMADMNARYGSAREMLDDLIAFDTSEDPFAMRPADLPSFGGSQVSEEARRAAEVPPLPTTPPPVWVPPPATPIPLDPDRTRRRRRGGLVAATVMGLGLFALLGLGAVFMTAPSHGGPITVSVHSDRFDPEDREALRLAEGIRRSEWVPVSSDVPDTWEESILEQTRVASNSEDTQPVTTNHGRVLVLEDLPRPQGERVVQDVRESLRKRGYRVVGMDLGDTGHALDETDITLVAGARNAVGLGTPLEDEAVLRLQAYLNTTEELVAILWLDTTGDGTDTLIQLVVRDDRPAELRDRTEGTVRDLSASRWRWSESRPRRDRQ